MPALRDTPFPHRRNPDGSYDSICVVCFATVGSSKTEDELEIAEQDHTCDQTRLYQLQKSLPNDTPMPWITSASKTL